MLEEDDGFGEERVGGPDGYAGLDVAERADGVAGGVLPVVGVVAPVDDVVAHVLEEVGNALVNSSKIES